MCLIAHTYVCVCNCICVHLHLLVFCEKVAQNTWFLLVKIAALLGRASKLVHVCMYEYVCKYAITMYLRMCKCVYYNNVREIIKKQISVTLFSFSLVLQLVFCELCINKNNCRCCCCKRRSWVTCHVTGIFPLNHAFLIHFSVQLNLFLLFYLPLQGSSPY